MNSETATVLKASRTRTSFEKAFEIGNETVIKVRESMLENVGRVLHNREIGCVGFVLHHSEQEALTYTKRLKAGFKSDFNAPIINNKKTAVTMAKTVSPTRMRSFIKSLTGTFPNRFCSDFSIPSNASIGCLYGPKASNWVKGQWETITSSRRDIRVENYVHSKYAQNSIIVTIPGNSQNDGIVILGAHIDSTLKIEDGFSPDIIAPGADDNASGVAVLTEVLRAIVRTKYKPEKTIHLIGFAVEEIGFPGSREIASEYRRKGKNVVGMLNFDMVGYNKQNGLNDICITRDRLSNHAQSSFLVDLMNQYLPRLNHQFIECRPPCSDHAGWTENSFPAGMACECTDAVRNPNYHMPSDVVETINKDYMSNFARLGVYYIAELAKGTTNNNV